MSIVIFCPHFHFPVDCYQLHQTVIGDPLHPAFTHWVMTIVPSHFYPRNYIIYTTHVTVKYTEGYSIWDLEGGLNGKKNMWWGGVREKNKNMWGGGPWRNPIWGRPILSENVRSKWKKNMNGGSKKNPDHTSPKMVDPLLYRSYFFLFLRLLVFWG